MVTFEDVLSARERINKFIYKTPLELSYSLSNEHTKIFLKLESQQRLKSFKVRGALSKMTWLSEESRTEGVIAVSSGNHGAGVSFASYMLGGIKAKIFVPKTTPKAKLTKIKYYGAEVIETGENYDEAHKEAEEARKKEKLTFIDPCSDIQVIAGQGSIAFEILDENPDIDVIIAPIGGGGLITGISVAAKHLKPSIEIIGVQTAACPAMVAALRDKQCYFDYKSEESICDALVGGVGEIPYEMAAKCIDDIIVVNEETIRKAIVQLIEKDKVIAEPAGAASVAAIIENMERFKGKNVAVVVSGGNLDERLMYELLGYKYN
ncbi:threonine ammonia-lyase [Candidatus Clostridium radicumherbarum]|uniref:Threonine/serine dehydratase n=1 Tax=Candidatus Clostridium radicumherbarum TaxID=3381662 RepID=A0ABW8TQ35_9CLOT